MESDNRFALDVRLEDIVVCLYLKEHPSVSSRLMTYLECGDRCSSEVLSFLAIAD